MTEALRPWFSSGLLYVFADDFLPQEAVANAEADACGTEGRNNAAYGHGSGGPDTTVRHPAPVAAEAPAPYTGAVAQAGRPAPSARTQRKQAAQPPAPAAGSPATAASQATSHAFPAPWDAYAVKAKLDTPRPFCITYLELGKNLGGHADQARSRFFQALMTRLEALRGKTAFWPVAAFRTGSFHPDAEQFLQGVAQLQSQTILCFGLDAFRVLSPDAPAPKQSVSVANLHGRTVYLLPQVDAIIQKGPEGLDIIASALDRLLTPHP